MRARYTIAAFAACCAMVMGTSGIAGAAINPGTCAGGTLATGNYDHLTITGVCSLPDSGTVHVKSGLTVAPGGVLNAITPAVITVAGGIKVGEGAILGLGCSPAIGCDVTTNDRVYGNIVATGAAAVIIHSTGIRGNVSISGGGGGVNCDNNPIVQGPLYADMEDSHVYGSVTVTGLQTCWLGLIRNNVHGNVSDTNNTMADPDANEIVTNRIWGNLACSGNSPAAQEGDSGGKLNKVTGIQSGECAAL